MSSWSTWPAGPWARPCLALLLGPVGRWHGDRVAVVGDYADHHDLPPPDDATSLYRAYEEDRLVSVGRLARTLAVRTGGVSYTVTVDARTIDSSIDEEEIVVSTKTPDWEPPPSPDVWIVNLDARRHIDPAVFSHGRELIRSLSVGWSAAAGLILLLAVSNGRGGGDVRPHPLVGAWGGHRVAICVGPPPCGSVDLSAPTAEMVDACSGWRAPIPSQVVSADLRARPLAGPPPIGRSPRPSPPWSWS